MAFDAAHPNIDERRFKKYDWYDFYRGAKEAIPADCPEALGNSMSTHCLGKQGDKEADPPHVMRDQRQERHKATGGGAETKAE